MTKQQRRKKQPTRPSIKDVARESGVSVAAASYALNDKKGTSKNTRERVLKAAAKLNYQPSKFAQTMRTGKTDTVGLVVPDIHNPFLSMFAKSVQKAAYDSGRNVYLIDTNNDPDVELDSMTHLLQHGIDGLIWWPVEVKIPPRLEKKQVPTVFIDQKIGKYDSATTDHYHGGALLAELVNERGFKKVGLIRGPKTFPSALLRRAGFCDNINDDISIVWETENSFALPIAVKALDLVLRKDVEIIICPNDIIAIEVIKQLSDNGVQIPEEISVTGFGDISFSDVISPKLTTIHQPMGSLGQRAFELLARRIEEPDSKVENVVLDVELVLRESVRA